MKKLITTTLMAGSFLFAANAIAGDAAAGKAKSAVCAACHGAAGIATIPTYPNLAGQNKAYLISALNAYKSKQRNGGMAVVMHGQAAALTDQDIENLAEYYSSLK
jgi:cytochrome c553